MPSGVYMRRLISAIVVALCLLAGEAWANYGNVYSNKPAGMSKAQVLEISAPAPSIIFLGDSITNAATSQATLTAISASGGVVTATAAGHTFVVGDEVNIFGVTPTGFNGGPFYVTAKDTNTFTFTNLKAPDGAGSQKYNFSMAAQKSYSRSYGYANHAMSLSGQRANIIRFASAVGSWMQDMADRFEADVAAYNPKIVHVLAGVNDLAGSRTPAQVLADFTTIHQKAKSAGITLIAGTVCPVASGLATAATVSPNITAYNKLLKKYCQANGIPLADYYSALVDPTSANGYAKTGVIQSDNLHPTGYGHSLMGAQLSPILNTLFTPLDTMPTSQADAGAAAGNFFSNPMHITSAAATGTGVSGTKSSEISSITLTGATLAAAASLEDRTVSADGDAFGKNCVIAVTGAGAASDQIVVNMQKATSTWTPSVDSYMWVEGHFQITGITGGLLGEWNIIDNPSVYGTHAIITCATNNTTIGSAGDISVKFKSAKIFIPAGTAVAQVWPYFYAKAGTATGWTMKIGRTAYRFEAAN
jgi:lysophospholipase L1-like esterase